jgi:FkbM family methyltransferase
LNLDTAAPGFSHPRVLASALVRFYFLVHGRFRLPGAGWLLRRVARVVPGLRAFPLDVPGVGMAEVDFRDEAVFTLLNLGLGELGNHAALISWMERCLAPGAVLWDVGANVGFVSAHFAHPRHRLGAVHAFEPAPGPLRVLDSLFRGHKLVRVHPFGLGARDEELALRVQPGSSAYSSLKRELDHATTVPIRIRRGDEVQRELFLPPPDVIKVDVEGFEPQVFDGLRETLRVRKPVVFFEHIMLTDEQVRALQPDGWTLRFILDDGRLAEDFRERMRGHDAVLLPPEKRELLVNTNRPAAG